MRHAKRIAAVLALAWSSVAVGGEVDGETIERMLTALDARTGGTDEGPLFLWGPDNQPTREFRSGAEASRYATLRSFGLNPDGNSTPWIALGGFVLSAAFFVRRRRLTRARAPAA